MSYRGDAVVMRELAQQRAQTRRDEDQRVFNALSAFEEVTLESLRVALGLGKHRKSWLHTRLQGFVRRGTACTWRDDTGHRKYRALIEGADK